MSGKHAHAVLNRPTILSEAARLLHELLYGEWYFLAIYDFGISNS